MAGLLSLPRVEWELSLAGHGRAPARGVARLLLAGGKAAGLREWEGGRTLPRARECCAWGETICVCMYEILILLMNEYMYVGRWIKYAYMCLSVYLHLCLFSCRCIIASPNSWVSEVRGSSDSLSLSAASMCIAGHNLTLMTGTQPLMSLALLLITSLLHERVSIATWGETAGVGTNSR